MNKNNKADNGCHFIPLNRSELEKEIKEYTQYLKDNENHSNFLRRHIDLCEEKIVALGPKPLAKGWIPKKGDQYWIINSCGGSESLQWNDVMRNHYHKEQGVIPIQPTEEQAVILNYQRICGIKYKARLVELNQGWKPDWSDENQKKYYLAHKHYDGGELMVGVANSIQCLNDDEYFSFEAAEKVIKDLGHLWKQWKAIENFNYEVRSSGEFTLGF